MRFRVVCTVLVLGVAAGSGAWAAPTESLIENGSFEAPLSGDGQPPGFRVGKVDSETKAEGTFALTGDAHSGKQALEITRSNAETGYALWINIAPFEAGAAPRQIAVVWWQKLLGERGREAARLRDQAFTPEWKSACRSISATEPNPYLLEWQKQAVLLEQRPGNAIHHFRLMLDVKQAGDGVVVDDLALFDVTAWRRDEVAALMQRERAPLPAEAVDRGNAQKRNLLENSSFELGLSRGWSVRGILPQAQREAVNTTDAHHGARSMRLTYGDNGGLTLSGKFVRVRVHRTHTLSAWCKASGPGARVLLRFENGYVPDNGSAHAYQVQEDLPAGEWRRVSVSGITQGGPEDAYAIQIKASGTEAGSVLIDAVQFEEGELTDYAPRRPVEAGLWLDDVTGLTGWEEPVQYTIAVYNDSAEPAKAALRTEIVDFEGRTVRQAPVETGPLAPGLTTLAQNHAAPARGSLRTRVWMDERTEPEDEITLTVVPAPRHPERYPASRYGQHVRIEPWQMGVAKRLGAGWNRLHDSEACLSWNHVEPEPGKWVWADEQVDAAHAAGLEILGVLGRVPDWVDGEKAGSGAWRIPGDLEAWGRYVEAVTGHCRGRVDVWEIWNEP
ncbi:MAG: hypothetical protein JXR94_24665, partial [Candidatus Hydrogenedentes bacterium]|nr:hypothetical protein [Candidatus Hydrogenedentota bacterium]